MNTTIKVCQPKKGDVDKMHAMLSLFSEAFDDEESYSRARPSAEYFEKLLTRDHFIALIAEEGDKVVGAIAAYELMKFEQERSEIYIYDLAVDEGYRRQGIATALIEKLKDIAKERGAWVIYVQADYGDEPAIALYTKLGTREDVMHFDIELPPLAST